MRRAVSFGPRSDLSLRLLVTAILAPFTVFALLAARVAAGGTFAWDRFLFQHLYSGESDWAGGRTPGQDDGALHATLPIIYRLADARTLLMLTVTVVAVLILLRFVRAAAFFFAGIGVAALVPLLKEIFDRPSPFPLPNDPSFPSGHATGSMAIVAGLVVLVPWSKWRSAAIAVGLVFVLAVGVSVIADGGHWPSDVLAGWCLSLAWLTMLRAVVGDPLGRSAARNQNLDSAGARVAPPAGTGSTSPV
jgi:membrane-associated phospholipid phosphatase